MRLTSRPKIEMPADRSGHLGGQIAALAFVLLAGAALSAWRAAQRRETALNARTWSRLLPKPEAETSTPALITEQVEPEASPTSAPATSSLPS